MPGDRRTLLFVGTEARHHAARRKGYWALVTGVVRRDGTSCTNNGIVSV